MSEPESELSLRSTDLQTRKWEGFVHIILSIISPSVYSALNLNNYQPLRRLNLH